MAQQVLEREARAMTRHPQWISLEDVELLRQGDDVTVIPRHDRETPHDLIPLLIILWLVVIACIVTVWLKWFAA